MDITSENSISDGFVSIVTIFQAKSIRKILVLLGSVEDKANTSSIASLKFDVFQNACRMRLAP